MDIVLDATDYTANRPSVCTIGTFDGVHVGHQHLIRSALADARDRGAQCAVITFHPHPRAVLGGGEVPYLTLPDEKADIMAQLGVDVLMTLPFTRETTRITAEAYVRWLVERVKMVSLWMGHDFALGHKRQGDAAFLAARGAELGFAVNVAEPRTDADGVMSSTRIRAALARGDMAEVNRGLGRPFCVRGALAHARAVRVPPEHALPAPGTYPVFVCGFMNVALVPDDGDVIRLANRIEDCDQLVVEFI